MSSLKIITEFFYLTKDNNDRQSNSSNTLKKFLNKPKTSLKILKDAVHSVYTLECTIQ